MTIAWIKVHINHEGNKAADLAAKEGAAGGQNIKLITTNMPWTNIKDCIENQIQDKWDQQWINDKRLKHKDILWKNRQK